jgi:hypothetical protein
MDLKISAMVGILGVSLYILSLRPSVWVFQIDGVNVVLWYKTAVSLPCEAKGDKILGAISGLTQKLLDMVSCSTCKD